MPSLKYLIRILSKEGTCQHSGRLRNLRTMVQKGNILNIITAVISLLLPCTAAQGQPLSSLPAAGRDARFTVLEREDRGTYDCLLIDYGLRSYLLLPDGADSLTRCPGIVMLHDHGARFDIGKEKLARPLESALRNPWASFSSPFFSSIRCLIFILS